MSQALTNMWVSFIGLFLMFVSVGGVVWGREKLSGIPQKIVFFISFICLVVAGIIVFLIVFGGPTSEYKL